MCVLKFCVPVMIKGGGGREKKGWTGTSQQAFGVLFHAGPLNQRIFEKSAKYAY